jgi:hypothetical protein
MLLDQRDFQGLFQLEFGMSGTHRALHDSPHPRDLLRGCRDEVLRREAELLRQFRQRRRRAERPMPMLRPSAPGIAS